MYEGEEESMKLNKNQKKFLFDNYYLDSKMLDSLVYKGWENFWIDGFKFELDTNLNRWNMRTLSLVDKDLNYEVMSFDLNFQENDFDELLKIS